METNFLHYDKNEIKNRIECTIKAFKHNAKWKTNNCHKYNYFYYGFNVHYSNKYA
jgi:hypothetical protein